MKFLMTLVTAALLWSPGPAQAEDFDIEGKYELVEPPQPTETPGKVEVLEIFWYGCTYCFGMLSAIENYIQTKPEYVEVRRMPAIFRKDWRIHAGAFYTAEALGISEKTHRAFYEAIQVHERKLDTREALVEFFKAFGVSKGDFDNSFDSAAVEAKVKKSKVMLKRYGIRGTPSVIINGKYRISGGDEDLVKLIQRLVEKERQHPLASR